MRVNNNNISSNPQAIVADPLISNVDYNNNKEKVNLSPAALEHPSSQVFQPSAFFRFKSKDISEEIEICLYFIYPNS